MREFRVLLLVSLALGAEGFWAGSLVLRTGAVMNQRAQRVRVGGAERLRANAFPKLRMGPEDLGAEELKVKGDGEVQHRARGDDGLGLPRKAGQKELRAEGLRGLGVKVLSSLILLWGSKPSEAQAEFVQVNPRNAGTYFSRFYEEEEEMHPIAQFVTDKRVITAVGVGAGGTGSFLLLRWWQKGKKQRRADRLTKTSGGFVRDTTVLDDPLRGRGTPEKELDMTKKYKFDQGPKVVIDEDEAQKALDDLFSKKKPSAAPEGDVVAKAEVEVVDGSKKGPKTTQEKELEQTLGGIDRDENLSKVVQDPFAVDPSVVAEALPEIQKQMAEILKEGLEADDVAMVRASFQEMGIDLDQLFGAIDDLEKAGLADETLGKEGVEFFDTLKAILREKK